MRSVCGKSEVRAVSKSNVTEGASLFGSVHFRLIINTYTSQLANIFVCRVIVQVYAVARRAHNNSLGGVVEKQNSCKPCVGVIY